MNWLEISLLAGCVSLTALLIWINRWWVVREGETVNRRWYVEACLKWAATIVNAVVIRHDLMYIDTSASVSFRLTSLAAATLVTAAIWSTPTQRPIRVLATAPSILISLAFHFQFSFARMDALFESLPPEIQSQLPPHTPSPPPTATGSDLIVIFVYTVITLLAIWVPARKPVPREPLNELAVRL